LQNGAKSDRLQISGPVFFTPGWGKIPGKSVAPDKRGNAGMGSFTSNSNKMNLIILLQSTRIASKIAGLSELLLGIGMFTTAITAFLIGIKNYTKLEQFKILLLIPFAEIIIDLKDIILSIAIYQPFHSLNPIRQFIINLPIDIADFYNILEFISIQLFLTQILRNSTSKKLTTIFAYIFPVLFLYIAIKYPSIKTAGSFSYSISSFILIITLMTFFRETILDEKYVFYQKDPNFIITSGLFITFCVTFPTFMLLQFTPPSEFLVTNSLMALNFLCYIFLFLTMIKAFICQIELKKLS
jgi:hypothetical protein